MRLPVLDRRRAGVLLHLGSLEDGLGRGGRAFIDWLAEAGFSVWQVLPLGPTGPDGSPYWVRSDFAGNPVFLDRSELPGAAPEDYAAFVAETEQWLDDYALFEVLSGVHSGAVWWTWPADVRDRVPSALARVTHDLAAELEHVKREQFAFFVQWRRLREHARVRGVRILGDLPFYVAPHSAETWAHREQFQLDAAGRPAAVAGVPPDYFSQTGQLWGNPLYDWQAMRRDNFAYWRARVLAQLQRVDLLRIDHFRALAAHWAVPAGAPDARGGEWRLTPGEDLLRLLMDELGDLPIVAEDLGVITDDVVALRKGFGLPGMRVLQFAFSGEGDNPHLPHMHGHDTVIYTGTHDNDTTLGWYQSLDEDTRRRVDSMLRAAPGSMLEAFIREALGSVGQLAIIPAQDLLGLGCEARLNTPGTVDGNWFWRLPAGALTLDLARHFAQLNGIYGRL
ncbi:MAG TPA: 4-alpha-glucanotransferase [Steroidobacteraceae bacterium]|jgi:4-alpha-glucanotransferase|nr:4-alpha-glucanotransferase [Steroidobacteraceae bacterium]